MSFHAYKFLVQAIVQARDDEGNVTGEVALGGPNGEPTVVFGCDALKQWADDFPAMLEAAEADQKRKEAGHG